MLARSSSRGSNPADVCPRPECTRPRGAVLAGGDAVAAEMKEIADLVVGGEEALRLAWRLEALHLPFSSSRRLVRILRPVVEALVPAVLHRGHHLALRRAVAGQLVRDHGAGWPPLALQELAQQALGGPLVASTLDQHIQHHPALVDRAPGLPRDWGSGCRGLVREQVIGGVEALPEVVAERAVVDGAANLEQPVGATP